MKRPHSTFSFDKLRIPSEAERHIPHSNKGFTLIELLVSVAIFTFLTGLILVNHGRFTSAILLENLAYDVGLSIREAQIFGLSVKEFEPGSGQFQQGYGVHFDASTPAQYIIFADRRPSPVFHQTGNTMRLPVGTLVQSV